MMGSGETYLELLLDLPHWLFELTVEFVTSVVFGMLIVRYFWPRFKVWLRQYFVADAVRQEHAFHGHVDHDVEMPLEHRVRALEELVGKKSPGQDFGNGSRDGEGPDDGVE